MTAVSALSWKAVSRMKAIRRSLPIILLAVAPAIPIAGQKKAVEQPQRETVAKPLTEKQAKINNAKLRKELETPYRKWLNEDVKYIITQEETDAFKRLETDEEREQFIEQFWLRRDPTPDTAENEFKEEHYRRIAYANERFASGIPGWKTDRGRTYITFGPPDEIEDHSSGGSYVRPTEEGGGETSTFPFQKWRYRYIEDVGSDINIEFVDTTMSGEFRMTMDPSEKDALLMVPGAGLTMYEQMGLSSKEDRFNRSDGTRLGVPADQMSSKMNQFNRLEQYAKLQKPPAVKFKDLEGIANSRISYNMLPMKVRVDFFPTTEASSQTAITVQFNNKDLQFTSKDGVQKAIINIAGTVTTMGRRVAQRFEQTVTVDSPKEMLQDYAKQKSVYWSVFTLPPGDYRLNVVAKDQVAGTISNYEIAIKVPRLDPDNLSASTMVLADLIEPVPMKNIGTGQFVLGSSKVRPRVDETFTRAEKMGIYLRLYNFGADEATHKPSGEVKYEVTRNGTNEKIFEYTEDLIQIPNSSASQVTVEKLLPLTTLAPGQYTVKVTVTDRIRKQVLTPPAAQFTVT
jgi:GWxTD domain-containing protein